MRPAAGCWCPRTIRPPWRRRRNGCWRMRARASCYPTPRASPRSAIAGPPSPTTITASWGGSPPPAGVAPGPTHVLSHCREEDCSPVPARLSRGRGRRRVRARHGSGAGRGHLFRPGTALLPPRVPPRPAHLRHGLLELGLFLLRLHRPAHGGRAPPRLGALRVRRRAPLRQPGQHLLSRALAGGPAGAHVAVLSPALLDPVRGGRLGDVPAVARAGSPALGGVRGGAGVPVDRHPHLVGLRRPRRPHHRGDPGAAAVLLPAPGHPHRAAGALRGRGGRRRPGPALLPDPERLLPAAGGVPLGPLLPVPLRA